MQIKVTGKNLDIGDALREHIQSRLSLIQQKYFDGTVHAHVTVEKQRSSFHTDCALHLATGLVLQAEGSGPEAHPSFDQAASHLEKNGHYVALGRLGPKDRIMIDFPLQDRSADEQISLVHYSLRWRGNYVIRIFPSARVLPMYP